MSLTDEQCDEILGDAVIDSGWMREEFREEFRTALRAAYGVACHDCSEALMATGRYVNVRVEAVGHLGMTVMDVVRADAELCCSITAFNAGG